MCGFVGVVSRRGQVDVDSVRRMRDTLVHRGPDDEGMYVSADGTVALGHRRLSIIDLSPLGRQPMGNEDETVWAVYNGEIYNFRQLRAELEELGHTFRSNTDTEVIVHGYEQWGGACVERFRGMFALAVWDEPRRRVFLARDRIGIKPLFYYWDGDVFIFASELKAITGYPGVDTGMDTSALFDYLTYLYIPGPKTAYAKVRKLLPGHVMTFDDGEPHAEPYWDVPAFGTCRLDGAQASELLIEKLRDAVGSHLISDVPVGVLLSGGLDSSTVTSMADEVTDGSLHTFTVGFDVAGHSEVEYARAVAQRFSTRHTESVVSVASVREALGHMVGLYDEPFADSSAIPTTEVCRVAREGVKVALSGDGGDEVFGGYRRYPAIRQRMKWLRLPAPLRRTLFAPLASRWPAGRRGAGFLADLASAHPVEVYAHRVEVFTPAEKRRILGPEWGREFRDYDDYWYYRQHWHADLDPMTRLQYVDLKTYLPDDILTKVDRASMAVSLEVRPPLIDHELVEFVFSVPPEVRWADGEMKHLLKHAMRERLPAEVLTRGKKGFSVPWRSWEKSEAPWIREALTGGTSVREGVLEPRELERFLDVGGGGLRTWSLLVLDQWLEGHAAAPSRTPTP